MGIEGIGQLLALDDNEEEQLAHHAPKLDGITAEELERVARVAYRVSQVEAERTAKILPPGTVLKPWREKTARERVEAVATVTRILQSLVLLGWLEPPAH